MRGISYVIAGAEVDFYALIPTMNGGPPVLLLSLISGADGGILQIWRKQSMVWRHLLVDLCISKDHNTIGKDLSNYEF